MVLFSVSPLTSYPPFLHLPILCLILIYLFFVFSLSRNLNQLKRRYATQEYNHKELEAKLHRTEQQKTQLDIERNKLKPAIKELQEKKQQQLRLVINYIPYTLILVMCLIQLPPDT